MADEPTVTIPLSVFTSITKTLVDLRDKCMDDCNALDDHLETLAEVVSE